MFLPAGFYPPWADGYAMEAARPAGHDTLDPLTLPFGALARNTLEPSTTRAVENIVDALGDIFDWDFMY
jgi:hypothetical protein